MAQTAELSTLHRTLEQLRSCVDELRGRYGDIPAVKRLVGDVDRMSIDASELESLPTFVTPAAPGGVTVIPDEPLDPALWADADDEGLGGYHRGGGS